MGVKLEKRGHWVAFVSALLLAALVFLPFIIMNKGMFFYYGDFNVQQIPFYMHAHDMVRSGQIYWDSITDLGVNFIGSYSFYLLFSPFFWLTLPFPSSAIPYLMAPLLILKTACAALTSYLYLKRFVQDRFYALIGSLLYAFSGFMIYNVFFNHFHEAAVFFPLMLIGLEQLMTENKRGFFALAVAVNAIVNYWFFIGEVVFIILYFIVRSASKGCRFTFGRFFSVAWEGLLGVAMAAVVFLPSVLAIMGNPRTGADDLINGWGMWVYGNGQRYLALLHSLFFPPDLASLPNFFPDHGAKWASLAAYLPLFGATGAVAFCQARRGHWLRRMLIASAFFAAIPVLNATFVLLNNSYYTRWFYMPILLMCAATALALEQRDISWKGGVALGAGVVAAISLAVGLSPVRRDGEWELGLSNYPEKMWINVGLALLGLLLVSLLLFRLRDNPSFKRMVASSVCVITVIYSITMILGGVLAFPNNDWIADTALAGRGRIELPEDDNFARVDVYEGKENLGLYWEMPSLQAFHSIVPVSIMEFYPSVGVKRDVSSKPSTDLYALRPLLSVRWLFVSEQAEDQEPMPGYAYYDTQQGYNIYENEYYIPLGFSYDYYIDSYQWESVSEATRSNLLLAGVLLDDDQIKRYGDLLEPMDDDEVFDHGTETAYFNDAADRQAMAAVRTEFDRYGFVSHTDFTRERLVFYSVPWDRGWRAAVNGQPVTIEKVNNGFMALRVPAGEAVVEFDYYPPGLYWGSILSGAALLIWLLYTLLAFRRRRRAGAAEAGTRPEYPGLPPLPPPPKLPPLEGLGRRAAEQPPLPPWPDEGPLGPDGKPLLGFQLLDEEVTLAREEPLHPPRKEQTAPEGNMGDAWRKYESMLRDEGDARS